jgi:LPPG:FO 2-phospho-L-lactate transferase
LQQAELVIICPSNPWVSIGPLLAIPGIQDAIRSRPTVAVSPIIGGQAVKGPAAKMYLELGIQPSAKAVADHYHDLLSGFVIDYLDREWESSIRTPELQVLVAQTLMQTPLDRSRLAKEVVKFGLTTSRPTTLE